MPSKGSERHIFSFDGGNKLTILAALNVGKCFVRSDVDLHHGSNL